MPRVYGVLHIVFIAMLGLMGWGILLYLQFGPNHPVGHLRITWEHGSVLVLLAGARFLSFRIYRRARVALDSAFYVSSAFVFGVLASAWLLAITLTADATINLLRGTGPFTGGRGNWQQSLAYVVFQGGLPCLVLIGCQVAFRAAFGPIQVQYLTDLQLSWMLPGLSLSFLLSHYSLAGGAAWSQGLTPGSVWRKFFFPVVGAEVILIPLALAMAMGYKHRGIVLFLLIGFTGLVFGGIFRSWANASEKVRRRMIELSVVNQLSRTLAKSIDQNNLFQNLAEATLQLVGRSSYFTVGLIEPKTGHVHYEVFDGRASLVERLVAPVDDGISGWVLQHNEALILGDLQASYAAYSKDDRYNDTRFHSWLGVPLTIYGETVGIISVQSEQHRAYTADQLRVMNIIADQAAVAIEASRLYELATIDSLTGLFVRRYFDQRLDEELHRSSRYGTPFSLGLLDLDHFKRTNDTFGHQVGDRVLRQAARAMRDNMRSFDLAARYGGEEFVFILPRTGLDEAERVAQRILEDIEGLNVKTDVVGVGVRTTASIGLAAFPAEGLHSGQELIAAADAALYRAKKAGRNRTESHSPTAEHSQGNDGSQSPLAVDLRAGAAASDEPNPVLAAQKSKDSSDSDEQSLNPAEP